MVASLTCIPHKDMKESGIFPTWNESQHFSLFRQEDTSSKGTYYPHDQVEDKIVAFGFKLHDVRIEGFSYYSPVSSLPSKICKASTVPAILRCQRVFFSAAHAMPSRTQQSVMVEKMSHNENDSAGHKKKKRCFSGGSGDADGIGTSLPSVEHVASMGLEAKVDMATHGQSSWALTNLNGWRSSSLSTENSAGFLREKQREARRALLRGGGESVGDRRQETGVANEVTDAGH